MARSTDSAGCLSNVDGGAMAAGCASVGRRLEVVASAQEGVVGGWAEEVKHVKSWQSHVAVPSFHLVVSMLNAFICFVSSLGFLLTQTTRPKQS